MSEKLKIDGHPYRFYSDGMVRLMILLVVDIPLVLIVIGMVWLYLLALVVRVISDRLQSLANARF